MPDEKECPIDQHGTFNVPVKTLNLADLKYPNVNVRSLLQIYIP